MPTCTRRKLINATNYREDEAFLDVTEAALSGSATQMARDIKQAILGQTGLRASAGVSYNKFLAKVASAYKKPNGLTVITPQTALEFLDVLPIGKIFGVGEATFARLKALGIATGRDLKQLSLATLQEQFGKRGTMLYHFVRGEDDRPVEVERERKSVGKETTFPSDKVGREALLAVLEHLAEQVALRLIEAQLAGTTITLKLRWHDFQLVTRSMSVASPIQDAPTMMRSLQTLLDQVLEENRPVRLLGVTLSGLVPESSLTPYEQMSMHPLWKEG